MSAKRFYWLPDDVALLAQLYATTPTANIARTIGTTPESVHRKANSLGLRKDREFISEMNRRAISTPGHGSHATRFQPGLTPPNKGLKRPGWAPGRMAETQFKSGRSPAENRNYRPIGSLRVTKDGMLERKVTDDQSIVPARRWVAEARLVWEAAHGAVPDGLIITFKPGCATTDPALITIDKLEALSRSELMARNTIMRYPFQLRRVMRLRAALGRAVEAAKHPEEETTT